MATINVYKWSGNDLFQHKMDTDTGQLLTGRNNVKHILTNLGTRENIKPIFKQGVHVDRELIDDIGLRPDIVYATEAYPETYRRLGPNGNEYNVKSWDTPTPSDWVYPPRQEPYKGELTREYAFKPGTNEIFRYDYNKAGRLINNVQVGHKDADGNIHFYENLSPSALRNFGVPFDAPYFVQGVQYKHNDRGYVPVYTQQPQTPGGDTDDQTGQTPGGSTDDQTGQTPGGSTGNQNNQNYTQIPYINFNDLLRQFEGAIPGYDPNLLQNQQDGGYQLPSGLNESGVDLNTLNAYFLNAYDEARKANIDRWNAAYQGAALNYAQTMQRLQGLGQQEAKEIARNYSLASKASQNDLIQRGLSATTVKPAIRSGYERQKNEALARLGERLRRESIGYQNQAFQQIYGALRDRSDVYPDFTIPYLFMKQGLGNP